MQTPTLAVSVVHGCLGHSLHQIFVASFRNIEKTSHQSSAQRTGSHDSETKLIVSQDELQKSNHQNILATFPLSWNGSDFTVLVMLPNI